MYAHSTLLCSCTYFSDNTQHCHCLLVKASMVLLIDQTLSRDSFSPSAVVPDRFPLFEPWNPPSFRSSTAVTRHDAGMSRMLEVIPSLSSCTVVFALTRLLPRTWTVSLYLGFHLYVLKPIAISLFTLSRSFHLKVYNSYSNTPTPTHEPCLNISDISSNKSNLCI